VAVSAFYGDRDNDYMMAKSEKAFRRAALLRSKTAWLFCHILIAMSIGRMILRIIRCQTCRLAANDSQNHSHDSHCNENMAKQPCCFAASQSGAAKSLWLFANICSL
jgi:hypothetical protein